jgi:hypothetical protein
MYPHEVVGQAVESVHDLLKNRHDIDRKMTENFIDPRRVITMWAPAMGQWIRWTWFNPCYNEPVLGEDSIYV